MLLDSVSGESLIPGLWEVCSHCVFTGGWGNGAAVWSLFYKAQMSPVGAPPSGPHQLPKTLLPKPTTLAVTFQHMNFGETQTFSGWHWVFNILTQAGQGYTKMSEVGGEGGAWVAQLSI